jgi:hypothetical protein
MEISKQAKRSFLVAQIQRCKTGEAALQLPQQNSDEDRRMSALASASDDGHAHP